MKDIFIIDDCKIVFILQHKDIIRKINETDDKQLVKLYCDGLEELIKKEFNCENVLHGDFTITEDMLK